MPPKCLVIITMIQYKFPTEILFITMLRYKNWVLFWLVDLITFLLQIFPGPLYFGELPLNFAACLEAAESMKSCDDGEHRCIVGKLSKLSYDSIAKLSDGVNTKFSPTLCDQNGEYIQHEMCTKLWRRHWISPWQFYYHFVALPFSCSLPFPSVKSYFNAVL